MFGITDVDIAEKNPILVFCFELFKNTPLHKRVYIHSIECVTLGIPLSPCTTGGCREVNSFS